MIKSWLTHDSRQSTANMELGPATAELAMSIIHTSIRLKQNPTCVKANDTTWLELPIYPFSVIIEKQMRVLIIMIEEPAPCLPLSSPYRHDPYFSYRTIITTTQRTVLCCPRIHSIPCCPARFFYRTFSPCSMRLSSQGSRVMESQTRLSESHRCEVT